jgi:hypothetical protein
MRNVMKLSVLLLGFGLFLIGSTPSYADHVRVGVDIGVPVGGYYYGDPYYYGAPYYGNPYYPGYVVASSSSYQPVVINGTTYYVNNGVYYIYTQYGYQAVASPVAAPGPVVVQSAVATSVPAAAGTGDSITVNIPNDKGGYNAVVLKPSGKGYVGPQGEFYSEFPKVSQLQLMYGK